jgi:hypothetical protein
MKRIENYGLCNLSYKELVEISGGDEPGRLLHDVGYVIGKIGGWIKNAFTADTQITTDTWMLDVDPKTLFG